METGGGGETVEVATCACCGIGEECTARYVAGVTAQFGGTWVCGLCAEAIKDEAARRGVGLEVATRAHAEFVAGAGADPTIQVARALLQLLKRVIATAPGAPVMPPAAAAAQDLDM
ncbi:hypothetical protein PR202_ga15928 [Eleusine coracana subsp. coracana]|uniref:Uncharacterized protein n=1 Tax=Eleusine coracana subsp. coracana TaxID=191504 RepID=A0AAV5CKW6_ELECO|nr:hypothetical protein QOZ80_6BG0487520 [Eleusine coracana subsp. coracana]GJM98880.1 hypothetical protein PR202_ga15928 [Eleusine coracana subsp. coracana]